MGPEGLNSLLRVSKYLHVLDIGRCEVLPNDVLVTLARHCTQLRSLSISKNYVMTDAGMLPMLHACTQVGTHTPFPSLPLSSLPSPPPPPVNPLPQLRLPRRPGGLCGPV